MKAPKQTHLFADNEHVTGNWAGQGRYHGLWLALHFPLHALTAVADNADAVLSAKLAVIHEVNGRPLIWQASPMAVNEGVKQGMPLAMAESLCENLVVLRRDEHKEETNLNTLAAWAYQYTSQVVCCYPHTLVLEIERSLSLFHGLEKLQETITHAVRQQATQSILAVAPTLAAAQLLAEHQHAACLPTEECLLKYLSSLSVNLLPLNTKQQKALAFIGVKTFAEFWALPKPDLTRRLDLQALNCMERVLGVIPDIPTTFQQPTRFSQTTELYVESDSTTVFMHVLSPMLSALEECLLRYDAGIQRLEVHFRHRHAEQAPTIVVVGCQQQTRSADVLSSILEQRLQHLQLPALATHVGLVVNTWQEYRPAGENLFSSQAEQQWQHTLELLRMRLGHAAVHQLKTVADYRPEKAWRHCAVRQHETPKSKTVAGIQQPLALLHQQHPIPQPKVLLSNPQRVESGWWDGHDVCRDYYPFTQGMQTWWIYHDLRTQHWWKQGVFI